MFSRQQLHLDLLQRIMDGEAKEERHQRVSLLASFMLVDLPAPTFLILPMVTRRSRVHHSDEWNQPTQTFCFMEFAQHGTSEHMVVSPNAINRKHCRSGIHDCSDGMADAIHTCSGGKCEQEWSTNPLHFLSELSR